MKDSQRPPKISSFKENQNGDLERFYKQQFKNRC